MRHFISLFVLSLLLFSCSDKNESYYPFDPVPFTKVKITDNFWSDRMETNREVTIPYAFRKCEETGRIDNFRIAGGIKEGEFQTRRGFDDSDVFKVMEGAAYSLIDHPDKELEAYLDSLVYYVGEAQEDDGYLYTVRTIMGDAPQTGNRYDNDVSKPRWMGIETGSHELYNIGHMYEAAVAHYNATGRRNFLDIAIKSADLVYKEFGWGKLEIFPGHQEIEIGLVKLYHATGDKKYLELAKFFLDVRGKTETKWTYNQSHMPVVEQEEAVGHAVRALYMFAGMADVAAITGEEEYLDAMDRLWHNIADYQLYITGGVGAPGGNEGFAGRYELSNHNAYCETCAAIANVLWNYRLFLTHGDAKYIDIVERSMYNNILSGISIEGNKFFYPNRLESRGGVERSEWFNVSCCPTNISRFIPSVPGYIYATRNDELIVNLYISSEADISVNKSEIKLVQESELPWGGNISLTIQSDSPVSMALKARIPSWASDKPLRSDLYTFRNGAAHAPEIKINDIPAKYEIVDGYMVFDRKWKDGDKVDINFHFEIRKLEAHNAVNADNGKIALQAGPLVYAAEWPDQEGGSVLNLVLDDNAPLSFGKQEILENKILNIKGSGESLMLNKDGSIEKQNVSITAIPYFAWAHRGDGEMTVWFPIQDEAAVPVHYPTIASGSKVKSSRPRNTLKAIQDHRVPAFSGSREETNFNWWPQKDTTGWITYEFDRPETISECEIYWFSDAYRGGGVIMPESWKIYFRSSNKWLPVTATTDYEIKKDEISRVNFKAVKTDALKLEIEMGEKSAGLYEWIVK